MSVHTSGASIVRNLPAESNQVGGENKSVDEMICYSGKTQRNKKEKDVVHLVSNYHRFLEIS